MTITQGLEVVQLIRTPVASRLDMVDDRRELAALGPSTGEPVTVKRRSTEALPSSGGVELTLLPGTVAVAVTLDQRSTLIVESLTV